MSGEITSGLTQEDDSLYETYGFRGRGKGGVVRVHWPRGWANIAWFECKGPFAKKQKESAPRGHSNVSGLESSITTSNVLFLEWGGSVALGVFRISWYRAHQIELELLIIGMDHLTACLEERHSFRWDSPPELSKSYLGKIGLESFRQLSFWVLPQPVSSILSCWRAWGSCRGQCRSLWVVYCIYNGFGGVDNLEESVGTKPSFIQSKMKC